MNKEMKDKIKMKFQKKELTSLAIRYVLVSNILICTTSLIAMYVLDSIWPLFIMLLWFTPKFKVDVDMKNGL